MNLYTRSMFLFTYVLVGAYMLLPLMPWDFQGIGWLSFGAGFLLLNEMLGRVQIED